jgi:hypothetical protein
MEKDFNDYDGDTRFYWCDGSGQVELMLTGYEASRCSMQGDCTQAIEGELGDNDSLRARLEAIDTQTLADCLAEYTDWDVDDHQENLRRVLWIAAGDIQDQPEQYAEDDQYADIPSQAIYGFAESLDTSELGGLPECYRGQKVYEINIGTKDAAYGGWYFPIAYHIAYDPSEYTDDECEAFGDWEMECMSDVGTMSSHGPIPDSAIELVSHKDVIAWFKDCADAADRSDKPSVRFMVELDGSDSDCLAQDVIASIEREA